MSTIKCKKCDTELNEGNKFCFNCGEKTEQKCPKCVELVKSEDKFCSKCGYELQKESLTLNSGTDETNSKDEAENPISFVSHNFSGTFLWFGIIVISYITLNCIPIVGSFVAGIFVFIEFIKLIKVFIKEYSSYTKQCVAK